MEMLAKNNIRIFYHTAASGIIPRQHGYVIIIPGVSPTDFLDNQCYRLQDSFDVPEPEPIREAIRPFFNRWEYDQRLTGVKGVLPDNGCDPDIRRVLVHHVLSDLAYTLFTFFDTFSNGYEHDATFKNITLL